MAAPAVHRDTGEIMLALQTLATSGDPDRDLADALLRALDSAPGTAVDSAAPAAEGPRLRDLLDTSGEGLDITVHEDFSFWIIDGADVSPEAQPRWSTPTPPRTRPRSWSRSPRRTGRASARRATCAG